MAYRYFRSRTIYQIVATMETLFSVVILIFGSKAIVEFYEEDESFQAENQILLFASLAGIIVGLIQIAASAALIWSTRATSAPAFDKDDYAVSRIPTVWFFLSFLTFGLLLFTFLGPLLEIEVKRALKTNPIKQSIAHLFTYVVANGLFKFIFIWAMSTTIRWRRSRTTESLSLDR